MINVTGLIIVVAVVTLAAGMTGGLFALGLGNRRCSECLQRFTVLLQDGTELSPCSGLSGSTIPANSVVKGIRFPTLPDRLLPCISFRTCSQYGEGDSSEYESDLPFSMRRHGENGMDVLLDSPLNVGLYRDFSVFLIHDRRPDRVLYDHTFTWATSDAEVPV